MPCAGPNTLLAQGYTPSIVEQVHISIVRDIAAMKRADVSSSAAAASAGLHYDGGAVLFVGLDEVQETTAVAVDPELVSELARCRFQAPRPAFCSVDGLFEFREESAARALLCPPS